MATYTDNTHRPRVKIVYSKQVVNGRLELVPLELCADGTLKPAA